jgi:hypothetical protein
MLPRLSCVSVLLLLLFTSVMCEEPEKVHLSCPVPGARPFAAGHHFVCVGETGGGVCSVNIMPSAFGRVRTEQVTACVTRTLTGWLIS